MAEVFSAGDLNIDLFLHTGEKPAMGIEKSVPRVEYSIGGNAANFAMALSGLGKKTFLVSALGKDFYSEFLKTRLKSAGVTPLLYGSPEKNGISAIFVSGRDRAIMSNKGALLGFGSAMAGKKILPRLSAGDIVFFGGFFHMPKMRKGFGKLLSAINKKRARVFFDTTYDEHNNWSLDGFLSKIDTLFVNEIELGKIAGKSGGAGAAVKRLLKRGAKSVVLKRGGKGAEFFSSGAHITGPAVPVKVINATGAGDFFNAGYTYGAVKGYGVKACLECGNFAAARKISAEKYYLPRAAGLEKFLAGKNLAEARKVKNYAALSKAVAGEIINQLREKPGSVLALASGCTPSGAYSELAKAYRSGKADFSKAVFLELDEYEGAPRENTFGFNLRKKFIEKVNFREKNVHLFRGSVKNARKEIRGTESFIARKGIDFMLLGIGENGHIAFNEPGTRFSSGTHIAKLSRKTLRANSGKTGEKIPGKAITIGLKTVMSAEKIVLAANGAEKAYAVRKALKGKPSASVPASVLQGHKNAVFIVDRAAGKLL